MSLGVIAARAGKADRAVECYRQALRAEPTLTAAHFNLALLLLSRGDRAEARTHLESVIQAAPNDAEAHLCLGGILLDNRECASAIINLQAASQSPKPEVRHAALDALRIAQSIR